MNPLKWIKEYFNLTRVEANGTAVAVVLIIGIIIFQQFIPKIFAPEGQISEGKLDSLLKSYAELTSKSNKEGKEYVSNDFEENDQISYFDFDPNKVNEEQMQSLGLKAKIIRTIINYRNKGGKFYKPSDLQKIYGLSPVAYEKIRPYIQIDAVSYEKKTYSPFTVSKKSKTALVDINVADSVQLISIRGIGPAFAHRILKFRKSLGGFLSLNQLNEVYGLDSSMFKLIMPQVTISNTIEKLNINTASFVELNDHPYINKKQANAIVNYRLQHGSYHNLTDLKKLYVISDSELEKMLPYLSI